jgi:hypothetical protein
MLNEAKNRNLSPEGYEGGLLIDEMTIPGGQQNHWT